MTQINSLKNFSAIFNATLKRCHY